MKIKSFLLFLGVLFGINMLESQWVKAESTQSYDTTGGIRMVPNLDPTIPVDPTNPERPTHPKDPTNPNGPESGTKGPLSIDFASSIDFGRNRISNKDVMYYAEPQDIVFDDGTKKEVANYIQITDHRGNNAGWHLQVKQEQQLENTNAHYKVLEGAEIRLKQTYAVSNQTGDPTLVIPETPPIILRPGQTSDAMQAHQGSGGGTWLDVFGELRTVKVEQEELLKNTSITLSIPGKTPKNAVEYKSRLTWTLIDSPRV